VRHQIYFQSTYRGSENSRWLIRYTVLIVCCDPLTDILELSDFSRSSRASSRPAANIVWRKIASARGYVKYKVMM
jgi:hypothetical protein